MTYREGLGCTFDNSQSGYLDNVRISVDFVVDAPWPLGNRVDTIDASIQQTGAILAGLI